MANEVDFIELYGSPPGRPIRYTIGTLAAIEKGAALKLIDPRTASGANFTTATAGGVGNTVVAGFAAAEKENTNGTTITAYTDCMIEANLSGAGVLGDQLTIVEDNYLKSISGILAPSGAYLNTGLKLMETASDGERVNVRVNI